MPRRPSFFRLPPLERSVIVIGLMVFSGIGYVACSSADSRNYGEGVMGAGGDESGGSSNGAGTSGKSGGQNNGAGGTGHSGGGAAGASGSSGASSSTGGGVNQSGGGGAKEAGLKDSSLNDGPSSNAN
jgi:hypothetical protein